MLSIGIIMYWIDATAYREFLKSKKPVSLSIKCLWTLPSSFMLPFEQCFPGRRHMRCIHMYPCTHMYTLHSSLPAICSWKLQETIEPPFSQCLCCPAYALTLWWQRGNFLHGSGILAVDCDMYLCQSLIIFLWWLTSGKAIRASVQQKLKHMFILRVFVVSKDTLAVQGQAQEAGWNVELLN